MSILPIIPSVPPVKNDFNFEPRLGALVTLIVLPLIGIIAYLFSKSLEQQIDDLIAEKRLVEAYDLTRKLSNPNDFLDVISLSALFDAQNLGLAEVAACNIKIEERQHYALIRIFNYSLYLQKDLENATDVAQLIHYNQPLVQDLHQKLFTCYLKTQEFQVTLNFINQNQIPLSLKNIFSKELFKACIEYTDKTNAQLAFQLITNEKDRKDCQIKYQALWGEAIG